MSLSENRAQLAIRTPDKARLSAAAARRHSQLVRRLRLVVPALGAGLLATYAFSATPPVIDQRFLEDFENIDTSGDGMRLNAPRHVGYDLDGKPFEVAASVASRSDDTPSLIALENPKAFRGLDDSEDVNVRAVRGLMNTETKKLDLSDNVVLDHRFGGSDFTINTDAAAVDLETNTITSVAGVSGSGDRGTVAADTVTVYQNEGRAVFEGNVQFQIAPAAAKKDDESPE